VVKVVYVLEGTALYGGVKVVYQHAQILRSLGLDVEVVSKDPAPHWFPEVASFHRQIKDFSEIGPADIAVAAIYYMVPVVEKVPGAIPVHLCQCWEAAYEPLRNEWPSIEEIYRRPTLKLAVSPHLAELIEKRYGQPCTWIPQPLDTALFSPAPHNGPFRVLISGRWDLDVKGVERAMRALRGVEGIELVRLTQTVFDDERAFWPEAEYHEAIEPWKVPDLLRSVDVYVGMSTEVEGFGLPTLEAMACGRAAVVSDISAHRAMDPHQLATLRVVTDDELRDAVIRLRDDAALRSKLGAEGRRIAETFSYERTGKALIAALERRLQPAAPPASAGPPPAD
jgi:glycosyltransferase involved in cell wall biosynthesis